MTLNEDHLGKTGFNMMSYGRPAREALSAGTDVATDLSTEITALKARYGQLVNEGAASVGLRGLTSAAALSCLEAVDHFESTGSLSAMRDAVAEGFPSGFGTDKAAAYLPIADRAQDMDLGALYQAMLRAPDTFEDEALNAIILHTVLIRRGIEPDRNMQKLHLFYHANWSKLVKNLNVRWAVAYCDSVADSNIFSPGLRAQAALASNAINGIKVAISPYVVMAEAGVDLASQIAQADRRRLPLGGGMITFWQEGGDVIANSLERACRVAGNRYAPGLLLRLAIGRMLGGRHGMTQLQNLLSRSSNPVNSIKLGKLRAMISQAENRREPPAFVEPTSDCLDSELR